MGAIPIQEAIYLVKVILRSIQLIIANLPRTESGLDKIYVVKAYTASLIYSYNRLTFVF